jgi:hypothetical protein
MRKFIVSEAAVLMATIGLRGDSGIRQNGKPSRLHRIMVT